MNPAWKELPAGMRDAVLNEEYIHILQYGAFGLLFFAAYQPEVTYWEKMVEVQGGKVQKLYKENPGMPNLWEFAPAGP